MSIAKKVRKIIKDAGRTQTWVVNEMNLIDSGIDMNKVKFSAIVCGTRKMSGEELLAFCKALKINPNIFLDDENVAEA